MGKQVLGFDFGEKQVKIVYMVNRQIKKAVTLDLPEDLVSNGVIQSEDAMADFLNREMKKNGLRRKDAAVILPNSQVFTRTVTVPAMTDYQMKYNLPYEFRDYLTEEKSKYTYDYEIEEILENEDGQQKEMRVFACAAEKALIDQYREMFKRAGLKLKNAIPEEYAYSCLVREKLPENKAVCLVDLGHESVRVHMVRRGEYDSKRVLDYGLRDLDRIIAEQEDVDIHMAHSYKMSNYREILNCEAAEEFYRRIAVEIMKSINFYNYNNRDVDIEDLYFIGGGSEIAPLCREIEEMTQLKARDAGTILSNTEEASLFARAAGCAYAV